MTTARTQPGARPPTNGLLPVTASQTSGAAKSVSTKAPSPKLKVIVRRLAPGLTEAEFVSTLGEEWKLGKGKVDWFLYKPGKDSKDPSKPSRPSRAYLHLTNNDHLISLSDTVRQSTFEDAQNTHTNTCLIGPPSVEFAPYGRTPGGRRRVDARSGTIDQEPEFMAFLEALANPTTSTDVVESGVKVEKVTMTPLVQFLKDKKANKHKEAAVKLAKKQELKGKGKQKESHDDDKSKKDTKAEKSLEKVAKETVKILNRQVAQKKGKFDPVKAAEDAPTVVNSDGQTVKTFGHLPHRQRGAVIQAAQRMFKRDLNSAINQGDDKNAPSTGKETPDKATGPNTPKATQGGSRRGRGKDIEDTKPPAAQNATASSSSSPVVLLKKATPASASQIAKNTPSTPKAPPASRKPPPVDVPSAGATRAFVKHANPSQGVTEPLLKEAMEKFGAVTMVEIDKRKGFAYVDFADSEGLKKAMAANPTSVAQGTVQVMQRKPDRPERAPGPSAAPGKKPPFQGPPRGGRGGSVGRRGGGRGGGRGGQGGEGSKAPATAPTGPATK